MWRKVDIPCMVEERWSKMSGKLGQKLRRYQGDDESEMKRNEEILVIYTWYVN